MMQPLHEAHATRLKDDLLRPAAFAAVAPTEKVSLVETHISWVYLLDRDVFKVKKPVDLGFLNFASREQRREACEEEVRLNVRLAPGVYRGLVPITRGLDGRCVVGGVGRVIDWAVHMERLSDEERADTLLAQGTLTGERIDAIATRIAEFHDTARGDEKVNRFARPSAVAKNVQENFVQTRNALSQYLDPAEAEEIVRWQRAFVHDEQERFAQRIAQGRIRDGHGDLRLEHVYVGPGRAIRVLDCIEFNERFRYADVCADIAFLSMDLAAHGRVDLAERLLATYAREANDYDLYSVVDFYESYRAFVRGKVASMLANDEGVDPTTRRRAAQQARRYFLLALSSDRQGLLRPAVVAIGGVIASGKSVIANRLSTELSAPVIETDRTRKSVLGVNALRPLHEPPWSGVYSADFSDRVYDELFRRAGVVLASGRPVVLDASFRSAPLRRMARDLATAHGVPFRFIECRATPEVCRQRLAAREGQQTVSDGRLAIFDAFCARYEPPVELQADEHLVLDTTKPIEENVETLRQSLETWPRGLVG
jgi:uncharacterized protein